jgi:hypothetical protein
MQTSSLESYRDAFQQAQRRFDRSPLSTSGLVCKHGFYMQSLVLKLQKPAWTNDPIHQLQSQSGIFFSIWISNPSLQKNRALYNIHALKMRHLKDHSITSRAFAHDFRAHFAPFQKSWPNVSTDYGALTLMQGYIELTPQPVPDQLWPLIENFAPLSPLIDSLLASRRRPSKT